MLKYQSGPYQGALQITKDLLRCYLNSLNKYISPQDWFYYPHFLCWEREVVLFLFLFLICGGGGCCFLRLPPWLMEIPRLGA